MIERLLPVAASQHAPDFDAVLSSVHVHMGVQAIAWGTFLVICLIRFRRRASPQASHAGVAPVLPLLAIALVVVGDAVLLATAALPVWANRSRLPSDDERPVQVRVTAEQFAWNIHYPGPDGRFGRTTSALISASNPIGIDRASPGGADDVGLLNILTVPLGRPVIVALASRDVVHSFTLNEMRVRQDATPGQVVHTWFTPTAVGHWEIGCSQLCGLGHYRMRGSFAVLPEAEWTEWLRREVSLIPPARQ
jgi:cytochrome c oxidase subunit 2